MNAARPVLIMAGGTGGHVFPALAVAEVLRADGIPVLWMGTRRGLEARVVPKAGIPMIRIRVGGLRGKRVTVRLAAPFMLGLALFQALLVMVRRRPCAVLGMGGYSAGPGGVAAWLLRRPLLIHEQNAVPGLTNRWLARLAGRVMESFPGTFPARVGAVATGNPVRAAIVALPPPEERFAGRAGPLRLLVLGGSLGARAFNEVVPRALGRLSPRRRPHVWHQAGRRTFDAARARYEEARIADARVDPFIDDMARAYGWADLVLCRAGAMTVSELAVAGVAAILVPYPHAVDDHQTRNAQYLVERRAALLIAPADFGEARLLDCLDALHGERAHLLEMARAARAAGRPRAARVVADLCRRAAGL
ncbi:UDP-N-acetylglucosamine--N-acetylmuramyl-(pentapeptide) pyrophosphoryl-undecaprenol N-acetylglucosamine transferase [bacterium BMS3Bbin12]|nr:UDP-N-acetylglucosamine--N-acetylmuramyl-(pentapeptide) pyrophosphoryl-undecaprenol N-acetylglucosamine transferase [bacterium BMS3Abin12]GBE48527.1 UDP-N-acetylglucosamine--N-acetylmuramyl-(pentapeptide) pyrophosphoryl-undecaprenol N-acetylglucosamine transferase [bacterium BMS3Bbin12]GBE51514.1 UDP-N-acetylglucosamine--N-acetylmuramyl-(pentapeptide) pyrophosphoryl-undecaprenol N-acetylglucosamine transferase [bacterium BMS3Bbin13]HDJ86874.1 undecaprenyldiphospho-muramoylpentapeptide beta-N-